MPYKTQSPDTSPEVEKIYFDMIRRQTPNERLLCSRALTASAIRRERAMIARQHPEWDEQEVALQWAAIVYGPEIAEQVRNHLQKREA